MKNHSCLPGCSKGLKSICGTTIDIDDIDFGPTQNHLLYMDKVYSKGEGTACPLVFNITTSPTTFQSQLLMAPMSQNIENLCEEIFGDDCGCGCEHDNNCDCNCGCNSNSYQNCCIPCCNPVGSCKLDTNAVFKIVRSYVRIRNFNTNPPCSLTASQVTINGNCVDSLTYQGGAYEASIRQIVPNIVKKTCIDHGLPTKAFFLITGAGPWAYQADFVLEGTVTTGGSTCCFRAIFSTKSDHCIPNALSNLAVPKISIPCISGNISPRLFFAFGGKMNLLNPSISVVPCPMSDTLNLVLNSAVVAEPTVSVEVVKKSLFCMNGCEALFPCDGSAEFVENEEDEDDDDLYGPDCHCGCGNQKPNCGNQNSSCDDHDHDHEHNHNCGCGCGNQNSNSNDNCHDHDHHHHHDHSCGCNNNNSNSNNNCGCNNQQSNCGCSESDDANNCSDCTNSLPHNPVASCSSCCNGY